MSFTIALVGNPNAGKTTLFNALTGSNQFVGNWPGVTVEKKEGALRQNTDVKVMDLPGIYSLSPYSPEELITRRFLTEDRPNIILNIVDGTNLERNLYLTTQLLELGIPLVLAVNMMDAVERRGERIDTKQLGEQLGCAVTVMSALRGDGVEEAVTAALFAAEHPSKTVPKCCFEGAVEHALAHIEERLLHDMPELMQRYYAIKLFERDPKAREELNLPPTELAHIDYDIKLCEAQQDDDAEAIIISQRYDYIESVVDKCCTRPLKRGLSTSQKIDHVLTNRHLALPIFAAVMLLIYYISVTLVGGLAGTFVNDGLFGEGITLFGTQVPGLPGLLTEGMDALGTAPWLQGLLIDGVLAGVGAVLGFVPQMLALFFFLSFLEGCGYMSRIAFILDRLFRRFGLSGKSFIPMLVSTGCGVPGIMASRTIESPRERRMTVITTTFIPCGAKLPVIAMIAGAFFGGTWWVAPSAYFLGIAAVLFSGAILKKTRRFIGEESPFVMELPLYHLPTLSNILRSTWERGWSFIKKAGTVILLASIFIWFSSRFGFVDGSFTLLSEDALSQSLLAKLGGLIAWIFAPLGFGQWEAAVSTLLGLVAKEGILSTMSVLYGVTDGGYVALQQAMSQTAAYAFLAFNLLCAPCFAAIGAIRQEMNHRGWFWFAIAYQTGLAYTVSLCIYQFSLLFTGAGFRLGTVVALLLVALGVWLVLRKPQASPLRPIRKESPVC